MTGKRSALIVVCTGRFFRDGMYGCGCDRLSDSPGLRIAGDGGILQCLPGLSRPAFYCTVRDDRGTLVAL